MKKWWIILILAAAAVALISLVATKPSIQAGNESQASSETDPLKVPILEHMAKVESIRVGTQPDADLIAIRKNDSIEVTISKSLQERLGPGAAESLHMVDATATMSWNRYLTFLNNLHELLAKSPHALEHDDHEGGHSEHEGDDH